jgi:uncharacterized membrane protein YeaQ/YmgE (transglycosylase-associated protein family)
MSLSAQLAIVALAASSENDDSALANCPAAGPRRLGAVQGDVMDASVLVMWVVSGGVVGWLANQIMTNRTFGTQGDLIIGAVGGLVGGLFFPALGFLLGGSLLGHIVNGVVGAVIAVFASRYVQK